jgi:Tol biopolymer transport system component
MVQLDPDTSQNLYLLDESGKKPPTLYVTGPGRESVPVVSPSGRWATYVSDESGRFELYVLPFPGGGRRVQVSETGAVFSWWSRDDQRLTYVSSDLRNLWRVTMTSTGDSIAPGTPRQIASLPPDLIFIAMMPDESKFLALSPERTGTGSITVVQNWRAALKR